MLYFRFASSRNHCQKVDRESRIIRSPSSRIWRLLHRFSAQSRCDRYGYDSARLESREQEALPENGAFIAIENSIDDARRENAFGLLMSLNMLIEFGEAFDFTGADFWGWCREAGFRRYEVLHLAGPCSAAIAYK